jgi:hypothetical protein
VQLWGNGIYPQPRMGMEPQAEYTLPPIGAMPALVRLPGGRALEHAAAREPAAKVIRGARFRNGVEVIDAPA